MKYHLISGLLFSTAFITSNVHAVTPPEKNTPPAILTTPSKINLNTAKATEIAHALKGVGAKRAEAIITYREQHHGFQSLDELAQVPGLGKRFVERHLAEIQAVYTVSAPQETIEPKTKS